MESPILVTGPPRSGTTWIQWFLSQHPKIHIHGQESKNGLKFWYEFYDQMIKSSKWSTRSNKTKTVKNYLIPHYAGSNIEQCKEIWGHAFQKFMSGNGPNKSKWGCKFLWLCNNNDHVDRFEKIWTNIKWIVCIRDPFVSFESQKNTFVKDMDLETWLKRWIDTIKFIRNKKTFYFQIDKVNNLSFENKKQKLDNLLNYIGELPTKQTDAFIKKWEVVHKVKPNKDREFKISQNRKQSMFNKFKSLKKIMLNLGYGGEYG